MAESTTDTINHLKRTIAELESTTRMLVRRDLELKRAYRDLEEADQRKSEFVSIAAHQLRTPLSALLWTNQMLADGDLGELSGEQSVTVAQTLEVVKKLIRIVNDMLRADHLEYDKVQPKLVPFNFTHLVQDVVLTLKPMGEERRITVNTVMPDSPVRIVGGTEQLHEAVSNVLSNAIKYSYAESSVVVSVRDKADVVELSVEDHGIGIPADDQKNIFRKFTRADNARRVDANGSGLGLFIVQRIISLHRGTIVVHSTEAKGTTVTISLPKTHA